MRIRKAAAFLVALTIFTAFAAGAFAQITEPGQEERDDKKTKTTVTQEVQTTLPTNPAGETVVEEAVAVDNTNKEAQKLMQITQELTICVEMKDRILRLRCYDDLATDIGIMKEDFKTLERQKLSSYGFWQVLSETDQLGIETLFLSQSPYNKLSSPVLQTKVPSFNIRCRQGNTDAYIDWKSPLNGGRVILRDIFVFARTDSDEETRAVWSMSLDAFAAFAPDPIGFIKQMRGKRKLQIRITPYGGSTETLMFEIGMLEQALDIMVKRCYADGSSQQPPTTTRRQAQ